MSLSLRKGGDNVNIFEAFHQMNLGNIVKDSYGYWFKKEGDLLVDSVDEGKTWFPTDEFKYNNINQEWQLVLLEKEMHVLDEKNNYQ